MRLNNPREPLGVYIEIKLDGKICRYAIEVDDKEGFVKFLKTNQFGSVVYDKITNKPIETIEHGKVEIKLTDNAPTWAVKEFQRRRQDDQS